jgi:hypothetical protein
MHLIAIQTKPKEIWASKACSHSVVMMAAAIPPRKIVPMVGINSTNQQQKIGAVE